MWDECRHTQLPNGPFRLDDAYGADHFVTGPGGFLQAITHGLGGVRLEDDAMTLRPSLPENAEGLVLRRFAYRGVRLSLSVDASGIALEAHDSTHKTRLTVVADGSDSPAPLVPGKPLRFDVGAALTMRASSSVRVPTKADDLETAAAGAPPQPPAPPVTVFNPRFETPSFDGPAQNMPVGNGEVVANVWVDGVRNGSVALLFGRSDVFTGDVQAVKLGRLRIELEPNPFRRFFVPSLPGSRAGNFSQTLDLDSGLLSIRAGGVELRVWSDMNALGSSDSIHIEIAGHSPVTATVYVDSWRLETREVDCTDAGQSPNARGQCGIGATRTSSGNCTLTLPPDSLLTGTSAGYTLGWLRRNEHSVFKATLADQMLGELAERLADPLMNRTSGAVVIANSVGAGAFVRTNGTHAVSRPAKQHTISVFTHTMRAQSESDFLEEIMRRAKASRPPTLAMPDHKKWWAEFWSRSWIAMRATGDKAAAAHALSEAYSLHRYLVAIQSRGALPMHHNGGTVTWGWDGATHSDPDHRGWGSGYWNQNMRHAYWYTLFAGDTELLRPLFKMSMEQLPVMRERSRRWYNHSGLRFAETAYFFGAFLPVDYGCVRRTSDPPGPLSPYIKNHIEGGVELATMMLSDYQHTSDVELLRSAVLPWCESLLQFYLQHFPKRNGTLQLEHAQSCETWPDCTNPAAQVAALHRISEALSALPPEALSASQASLFASVAQALPAIPLTTGEHGRQIAPCQGVNQSQ